MSNGNYYVMWCFGIVAFCAGFAIAMMLVQEGWYMP
jgi:hypothetical protein